MPLAFPSGSTVVITVMPVAKLPMALRMLRIWSLVMMAASGAED